MFIGLMVSVFLMKPTATPAEEVRGVTNDMVKIGVIPDMTGPIATTWLAAVEGFRNYVRYINDQGGVHAYSSWYDDTPGMAKLREITLKLSPKKKDYTKNYSKGWLCAMILEEGMKRAGRNLDSESLVAALETFKNFDTGGVSGYITYGSNERMGGEYLRMYKADVENNKLIPVTDWIKPAH
ncbi:MAG: hypothetical protein C4549_04235 [Deltaproteobacteria bacterium]|nr:MAG: hypothetical protein C4549_04235 [Deltaproteobacteria bacterium]